MTLGRAGPICLLSRYDPSQCVAQALPLLTAGEAIMASIGTKGGCTFIQRKVFKVLKTFILSEVSGSVDNCWHFWREPEEHIWHEGHVYSPYNLHQSISNGKGQLYFSLIGVLHCLWNQWSQFVHSNSLISFVCIPFCTLPLPCFGPFLVCSLIITEALKGVFSASVYPHLSLP